MTGASCVFDPSTIVSVVLGVLAVVTAVVAAIGVLAVKVSENSAKVGQAAKDVHAAWAQIRLHEAALNGAVEAARKA